MKNLLILDIDGVLNADVKESMQEPMQLFSSWPRSWVDRVLVGRVKRLLDATGASVLWCSSWRRHLSPEAMESMLRVNFGITAPVVGCTPQFDFDGRAQKAEARAKEITSFLEKMPYMDQPSHLVVLDDNLLPEYARYQVVPESAVGVSEKDINDAIRLFKQPFSIVDILDSE